MSKIWPTFAQKQEKEAGKACPSTVHVYADLFSFLGSTHERLLSFDVGALPFVPRELSRTNLNGFDEWSAEDITGDICWVAYNCSVSRSQYESSSTHKAFYLNKELIDHAPPENLTPGLKLFINGGKILNCTI